MPPPRGPEPRKRRAPKPATAEAAAVAYWAAREDAFCRLTGKVSYPEPVGVAIVEELIKHWLATLDYRTPELLDFLADVGGFVLAWKNRYFSQALLEDVKDFLRGEPEFAVLLPGRVTRSSTPKAKRGRR